MVKKLKYLLLLIPFFTILNVNAENLGAPETYTYFSDGSEISGLATSIGYWGSENYWQSSSKIGSFTSASPNANSVQFFWNSANLCQNKDISISGTIAVLSDFFIEQTYNARVVMNGNNLACSFTQENSSRIRYTCFGTGGGNFQIFFEQTSFYGTYRNYNIAVSKSVELSCDVSNQAIVNQSITNTQNIINNQNSNTNQIIQDNQQNTQDIINNQNQNTQQEIESQKVCYTSLPFKLIKGKAFNNDGSIINTNSYYYTSDYILVPPSSTIQFNVSNFQSGSNNKIILYDENHTYIDYYSLNFSGKSFNTTSTTKYIRFSYLNNTGISITSSVPICKNGNQALNDSIISEDNPNTNQDINDMNDMVASDTPISDLITMPLTLINAYINGVNASCSPVNLGNLYGTDLTLPCINLEQRLGSNLWHIIDAFFSIFMCYNIGMLFVSAFDGITSLRDDFEGLYQPRHADTGYVPKHGGGN